MQRHRAVATRTRGLHQGVQQRPANAGPAHAGQHGHAADLARAADCAEQAARAHGLAEAVEGDCMHCAGIGCIVFKCRRNALLLDEHGIADGSRLGAKRGPVADAHVDHRLTGLEAVEQVAQGRRHGSGRLTHRVGKDIHQIALHQALRAAEHGGLQVHRAVADACAADADLELIVVARRAFVLERGLAYVEVAAERLHRGLVGQRHGAPIAGQRGVEVHQVVSVENDLLHVDFGPANA